MRKRGLFLLLFAGLFLNSCSQQSKVKSEEQPSKVSASEYLMQAVLWEQTSAEYRSLCYQAYNLAQLRVDFMLDTIKNTKNLAIITDIDETVLDNSPYEAMCIQKGKPFIEADWNTWVNMKSAKAVPGAVDFLNYVQTKGIEVFYVSNRTANQEEATIANMKTLNLPFADTTHLLLKKETSAKQARFDIVRKNHQVLLYLGDNCSDFTSKFRATSVERRFALSDSLRAHFGANYIVLPNPMYGDWAEKAIFKGKHDWNSAQIDSLRDESLIGY